MLIVWCVTGALGQATSLSDNYQQARNLAFEKKDYKAAINLCQYILQQDAGYTDAKILLGRLYYWNGNPDSAIVILDETFAQNPANADAALALADVHYFEKDYTQALLYTSKGLAHNPQARELLTRKATILAALGNYKHAHQLTDSLLVTEPGNSQLQALRAQLKEYSYSSRVEVTYDYTYFDKQFSDAWHLAGLSYGTQTKAGPVTARISYANRFATKGLQFEAEAYPKISKTFYTYTNIAYSKDLPVFPTVRAGFSLFANLPKAWEAEGGLRYLHFDDDVWAYTLAAGKYVGNFWVNGRVYLTEGTSRLANAYSLTTRYYLKSADNYVSAIVGWGVSPDDRAQAIRLNTASNLKTFKAGAGYRFTLATRHVLGINGVYENVEYQPETKGNQLQISTLYQFRF
ncbi:YaiO family outer membrane beta-barrel protein [Pontibacter fetidus]|uniref:YaiO family outer membrane beta-barrel protein n=1 Tax=Pontibacter fetidus TaxID=2700082 RepID=A0A6B2GX22_9BACT|nr:YaiO family outer membrane beta-barrel protein [Pontibacter fetidus]NDK55385.1 YaiO family outer membrane beta-barrel protein [Pontibacter fetidus]